MKSDIKISYYVSILFCCLIVINSNCLAQAQNFNTKGNEAYNELGECVISIDRGYASISKYTLTNGAYYYKVSKKMGYRTYVGICDMWGKEIIQLEYATTEFKYYDSINRKEPSGFYKIDHFYNNKEIPLNIYLAPDGRAYKQNGNSRTYLSDGTDGIIRETKPGTAKIDWKNFESIVYERVINANIGIIANSKINAINIYVNGSVMRGVNITRNDGYDMVVDKSLTLQEGINQIRIEVEDKDGITRNDKVVNYVPKVTKTNRKPRLAIIVGNSEYPDAPLNNAINDAVDMAAKLEKLGFDVIRVFNKKQSELDASIMNFGYKAKYYECVLMYYSGHGIQCDNNNYIIPIDVRVDSKGKISSSCPDMKNILQMMSNAQCPQKIIIWDACRNNNLNIPVSDGLCKIVAPRGTFMAFSTTPGEIAPDGLQTDRNSPYTRALLQALDIPNLSINDVFSEVASNLGNKNNGQIPWVYSSFATRFYFNNH